MPRKKQLGKDTSDSQCDEKIKRAELPLEVDLAAQRRLKTILDLAIAIGRREGLIGNNKENTAVETGETKEEQLDGDKRRVQSSQAAQTRQDSFGH
jgi:hypothetical protein